MSRLTRALCAALGGHDLGLPQVQDGRFRLVCRLGCGYRTCGVETRGQEQQRMAQEAKVTRVQQWRREAQKVKVA